MSFYFIVFGFSALFNTPVLSNVDQLVFEKTINLFDEDTAGMVKAGEFKNGMRNVTVTVKRYNPKTNLRNTLSSETIDEADWFDVAIPSNSLGSKLEIYASTRSTKYGTAQISIA